MADDSDDELREFGFSDDEERNTPIPDTIPNQAQTRTPNQKRDETPDKKKNLIFGDFLFRFPKFPFIHHFACMYFLPVQPLMKMTSRESTGVQQGTHVPSGKLSRAARNVESNNQTKFIDGEMIIHRIERVHNAFQNMLNENTSRVRKEYLEQSHIIEEKYFPSPNDSRDGTNIQKINLRVVDFVLPLCMYLNLKANGRLVTKKLTDKKNQEEEEIIHHPSVLEVNLLQQILTFQYSRPFLPGLNDLMLILNEKIYICDKIRYEEQKPEYLSNVETLTSIFMERNFNSFIQKIINSNKEYESVKLNQFDIGDFHERIPIALVGDVYNLVDRLLKKEFGDSDDFYVEHKNQSLNKIKEIAVRVHGMEKGLLKIRLIDDLREEKKTVWKNLLKDHAKMKDETINTFDFSEDPFQSSTSENLTILFDDYYGVMDSLLGGDTNTTLSEKFVDQCIRLHDRFENYIPIYEIDLYDSLLHHDGFKDFMSQLKTTLIRFLRIHYNQIINKKINKNLRNDSTVNSIETDDHIPNFLKSSVSTLRSKVEAKLHFKIALTSSSVPDLEKFKKILESIKSIVYKNHGALQMSYVNTSDTDYNAIKQRYAK